MSREHEVPLKLKRLRRHALNVGTVASKLAARAGDEETATWVLGEMKALGLLVPDENGNLVPGPDVEPRGTDGHAPEGILNPVITPEGKRLYPKSEAKAVAALSPEERNARRKPVVDVSGEDIERMRTDEGLTWTQIILKTGLGRTSLATRRTKWLHERAEALARDEADASRRGASSTAVDGAWPEGWIAAPDQRNRSEGTSA